MVKESPTKSGVVQSNFCGESSSLAGPIETKLVEVAGPPGERLRRGHTPLLAVQNGQRVGPGEGNVGGGVGAHKRTPTRRVIILQRRA